MSTGCRQRGRDWGSTRIWPAQRPHQPSQLATIHCRPLTFRCLRRQLQLVLCAAVRLRCLPVCVPGPHRLRLPLRQAVCRLGAGGRCVEAAGCWGRWLWQARSNPAVARTAWMVCGTAGCPPLREYARAAHAAVAAGGVVGVVNNYANLRHISNSITLWLGISPPDLFFYAVRAQQRLQAVLRCPGGCCNGGGAWMHHTAVLSCKWSAAADHTANRPCSPAAVPAAAAGGQRYTNRLLHVLQGDRKCLMGAGLGKVWVAACLTLNLGCGRCSSFEPSRRSHDVPLLSILPAHLLALCSCGCTACSWRSLWLSSPP